MKGGERERERVSLSPDNHHHHHDHSKFKGRQRERERVGTEKEGDTFRQRERETEKERNGKEMKSEVFMFGVCLSLYGHQFFSLLFSLLPLSFSFSPKKGKEGNYTENMSFLCVI